MSATNKFLQNIKKHQERKKPEVFNCFLEGYLNEIEKNKNIPVLSHKRLYEQIMSFGDLVLDEADPRCNKVFEGEKVRIYNYFSSQFFGMERPLEKVMRFFRSASMKGEESRQVLLLLGPVGAGKSALVEHIKTALEQCDPIYSLEGCPIREEPLHLIPRSLRPGFEDMYKIKIEGDLCPVCRHRLLSDCRV